MSKKLLSKICDEINEASNRYDDMAIRFVVCTDGTSYHVGQGINLTDRQDVGLNECSEMVCGIIFYHSEGENMIEIHGRGPKPEDKVNLRYSIPYRDIIQISYYDSQEYADKLIEIWPHMSELKED